MFNKKKMILLAASLLIAGFIIFVIFSSPSASYNSAADAAGGFPYQIGLTNAVIIPCFTTGNPPVCAGGELCAIKDPASCALYSEISGSPAGGMGSNGIFLKTAIAKSGLVSGGQLIAGGMSPAAMDNGVLASAGGCFGCVAKQNLADKIFIFFDKYIIAGFRN
ncbi:MAG: hypothetical protein V1667_02145 [bacterium]